MRTAYLTSRLFRACTTMMLTGGVFAATGCATSHENQVGHNLLGKSKDQIVMCAGVPLREQQADGITILEYYQEASLLDEAFPTPKSSLAKVHRGCSARVGLEDNHVIGVEYQSVPASSETVDLCQKIFEQCQPGDQAAR
jgi:hypothetical protein